MLTFASSPRIRTTAPKTRSRCAPPLVARTRYSAYVLFDQTTVASHVAGGQLDSARLELMLRDGSALPVAGTLLNAYRIPSSWAPGACTETGVTANCPNDTNTANAVLNCPRGAWDTTGFSTLTPTDQTLIKKDTRNWIGFDVTADVTAFLAGTANQRWYLVKEHNDNNERMVFWSRESSNQPRLVLYVTRSGQDVKLYSVLDEELPGDRRFTVTQHAPGATVPYSFSLANGYEDLRVMVDGSPVSASGVVVMDTAHRAPGVGIAHTYASRWHTRSLSERARTSHRLRPS